MFPLNNTVIGHKENNQICLFSFHLLSIKWIEVKFWSVFYCSFSLSVCGFSCFKCEPKLVLMSQFIYITKGMHCMHTFIIYKKYKYVLRFILNSVTVQLWSTLLWLWILSRLLFYSYYKLFHNLCQMFIVFVRHFSIWQTIKKKFQILRMTCLSVEALI